MSAPALAVSDDPKSDGRIGWLIAAAFFVGILGWAAFIRMDAAVYATGAIEVLGNRQSVQHPEGGVVTALHVREGDRVEAGQIVVELGSPQVSADAEARASEAIGLLALRARLVAERDRAPMLPPAQFAALSGADAEEAAEAIARQREQLIARREAILNEGAVYGRQRDQLNEQIQGYERQMVSNREQQRLIAEELTGIRELASRGFAPMSQVRSLERTAAALEGSEGEYRALAARAREAIGQVELQIAGLERARTQEVIESLRQTELSLGRALPLWEAALSRRDSTLVRAPASGKVVGLSVFTIGGVVSGGQVLMDIVPDNAALSIVTQVAPEAADEVRVGQSVEISFTGVRSPNLPKVMGTVVEFSADSFADERSGLRFYRAQIEVPPEEWGKLQEADAAMQLRPGLPVAAIIPTRKRTVLQYIFEPLTQHLWRSFRET